MDLQRFWIASLFAVVLPACAPSQGVKVNTAAHIKGPAASSEPTADIPEPVTRSLSLPAPRPQVRPETYSVVVNKVNVQELLFALARDARVNVDVHPGVQGPVTLNALDQTLPQLLTRISRQVDMRFELEGANLVVMPDSPFLRNYKIDYVSLTRDTSILLNVSTNLNSGTGGGASGQQSAQNTNTGSTTTIASVSKNRLWESLVVNLRELLRETDKQVITSQRSCETSTTARPPETATNAAPANAATARDGAATRRTNEIPQESINCTSVEFSQVASVMPNPETGVIAIRATGRQHEKVREFVDQIASNAKRQVLIEATIAEVELSQEYQQGIDWAALNVFDTGLSIIQRPQGLITQPTSTLIELGYKSKGGNFASSLKFLESFGNVRVMSSPKLTVLNNQSALMKVVDDIVYFTVKSETVFQNNSSNTQTVTTTTPHTTPVGLVMSVTPQVGDDDTITLNVRPSISRVIGEAVDPNPELTVRNAIPIIRSREFDSMMRVSNGNIAVLGGLMEDLLDYRTDAVPVASSTSLIGGLFQNRKDLKKKTELVIFIRPTIIRDLSAQGDFAGQSTRIRSNFFDERIGPDLIPPLPKEMQK